MSLSVLLIAISSIASGRPFYVGRKESVDWNTAKERCECWGGQLATFSSQAHYDLMESVFEGGSSAFGDRAWIGMTGNDQGKWEFIDHQTDYCNINNCANIGQWDKDEPNNPRSEQCAEINRLGVLNNMPCGTNQWYLCEFDTDNYVIGIERGDLAAPQIPWIPAGRGPQPVEFGTYSFQDLMVVALAVFGVINVVTLAVVCMRTKGAASIRYGKVMADSDA